MLNGRLDDERDNKMIDNVTSITVKITIGGDTSDIATTTENMPDTTITK